MKKIGMILFFLIFLTACSKESITSDGQIIGISNAKSDTKLQIKITTEYINIRKEMSVTSDIIGIVKKDSVFDVLDHDQVGGYHWVHIKTNNNLEGYVASFEDNIYYEFINEEIDFMAPKLEINVESINVDSFSEVTEEYIESIIQYSDDKDPNPILKYEVIDEGYNYYLNIEVTDSGNNKTQDTLKLYVNNEKLASNGNWITYNDIRELRKKFLSIIRKYGNTEEYDYLTNTYWKMNFYHDSTTISVFGDNGWFTGCIFNAKEKNIEVEACNDSLGAVSYEEFHPSIATQEQSAKNAYLHIIDEFEQTGYKLADAFINIES
ncbi:MAG: SH3 domain-containing protein [Bacilli bacterium]|nr:SH3 domain-containing protein [Bacilli bacterium]